MIGEGNKQHHVMLLVDEAPTLYLLSLSMLEYWHTWVVTSTYTASKCDKLNIDAHWLSVYLEAVFADFDWHDKA